MWELNIAGIATPWVAGDWLFAVTDDAKVMAIARNTGKIRWINQLPRFENDEDQARADQLRGPVLAGGRLIVAGRNGVIDQRRSGDRRFPEPDQRRRADQPAPVVANNTLYILDDKGRLHAYR